MIVQVSCFQKTLTASVIKSVQTGLECGMDVHVDVELESSISNLTTLVPMTLHVLYYKYYTINQSSMYIIVQFQAPICAGTTGSSTSISFELLLREVVYNYTRAMCSFKFPAESC